MSKVDEDLRFDYCRASSALIIVVSTHDHKVVGWSDVLVFITLVYIKYWMAESPSQSQEDIYCRLSHLGA